MGAVINTYGAFLCIFGFGLVLFQIGFLFLCIYDSFVMNKKLMMNKEVVMRCLIINKTNDRLAEYLAKLGEPPVAYEVEVPLDEQNNQVARVKFKNTDEVNSRESRRSNQVVIHLYKSTDKHNANQLKGDGFLQQNSVDRSGIRNEMFVYHGADIEETVEIPVESPDVGTIL